MFRFHPEFIQECFWDLAENPFHRHLAGYLGVKRCLQTRVDEDEQPYSSIDGIGFDYNGYFEAFHKVREGDKPYLLPFIESDATPENVWLNSNVAGTYAPSSVREGQPFDKVVDVDGSGNSATYHLRENHAEIAREELCEGQKIPAGLLSAFLYRDFGIRGETEPNAEDLVQIFRYEFGYRDEVDSQAEEFETLFEMPETAWEDAFYQVDA